MDGIVRAHPAISRVCSVLLSNAHRHIARICGAALQPRFALMFSFHGNCGSVVYPHWNEPVRGRAAVFQRFLGINVELPCLYAWTSYNAIALLYWLDQVLISIQPALVLSLGNDQ